MAIISDATKIDRAFKLTSGRSFSSTQKGLDNEDAPSGFIVGVSSIFSQDAAIPTTAPGISTSILTFFDSGTSGRYRMIYDISSPLNRAWYASTDGSTLTQMRLTRQGDWVPPTFGNYTIRIFLTKTSSTTAAYLQEIFFSDATAPLFDYKSGILTFESDPLAAYASIAGGPPDGIQISGYRYTGLLLSDIFDGYGTIVNTALVSGHPGFSGTGPLGADSGGVQGVGGSNIGDDAPSGFFGNYGVLGIGGEGGAIHHAGVGVYGKGGSDNGGGGGIGVQGAGVSGGNGVVGNGDGLGHGVVGTGGASDGVGVSGVGGGSNGDGVVGTGHGVGAAIKAIASSNNAALGFAALDPAGNVRFQTDNLGFSGGWINDIRERWYSGADATHLSGMNWAITLGTGTSSVVISSNGWNTQQTVDISRTDDAISSVVLAMDGWLGTIGSGFISFLEWDSSGTYNAGSTLNVNMGLRNESGSRIAYFQAPTGGTNWFAHTFDGTTDSSIDTGVAHTGHTTSNRRFRIEVIGSSTDAAATNRVRFYIDSIHIVDKTTNFPLAGGRLQPFFEYRSTGSISSAGSRTFTIGHVNGASSI